MKLQTMKFRILLVLSCAFLLSACSSKPRTVTASTPLVAESTQALSGTKIPENYWPQLNQAYTSELTHSEYQISLKPPYVSALGNECRELLITGNDQSQARIACEYTNTASGQPEWRLMPMLESNTSNISL